MGQLEPTEDRPPLTPYPRATPSSRNLITWGEHPITIALPYIATLVGVGMALSTGDDFPDRNRTTDWVAVTFVAALLLAGWSSALAVTLAMADRFKNREKCTAAIVNCFVTWSALFFSVPLWLFTLAPGFD